MTGIALHKYMAKVVSLFICFIYISYILNLKIKTIFMFKYDFEKYMYLQFIYKTILVKISLTAKYVPEQSSNVVFNMNCLKPHLAFINKNSTTINRIIFILMKPKGENIDTCKTTVCLTIFLSLSPG
jgi:hypothetical protein